MKFVSVCSGIEAASIAWEPLGWSALAFAEIEPFPCAVLAHHWPSVPNLGDLTKWREWPVELLAQADVLIGGTPCQSFSVAGLRAGLDDARGNLSLEFVRLSNAIDDLRRAAGRKPAYILYENVPGILSDSTNAFGCLLGGLAGSAAAIAHPSGASWPDAGVVAGPARAVGWRCLDAQHFGLAQRRKRVFVLARGGVGNWDGADALLPIGESVRGDRAAGRAARQDIAGYLSPGAHPGGANGQDAYTNQLVVAPQLARSIRAQGNDSHREDQSTYVVTAAPIICFADDIAHTLDGANGQAVGVDLQNYRLENGSLCGTLRAAAQVAGNSGAAVLQAKNPKAIMSFQQSSMTGRGTLGVDESTVVLRPVKPQSDHQFIVPNGAVRRLMPVETERLQGFPDDHTQVPYRGKSAPDSPRYKAVGNSMATPCIRWIGQQIMRVEADHAV